jgi:two-component system sensor histidine kinase PilS (NtrC family)
MSIIAGAFLLQMHGGLGIALFASFCYACYGILEAKGVLSVPGTDQGTSSGFLQAYMHVSLFFVVGAVSGYIAERSKVRGRQLMNARSELRQLKIDTDRILDHMSSGVLVVDSSGRILTINPTAEHVLGVDERDILGLHVETAFDPLMPEFAGELLRALKSEQGKLRHEVMIERPHGCHLPLGLSISILRDETARKRGVIVVFQDLTEVREMQERVRKTDRLAAIGELSAGIAHEVRNPLASISGSIEMLYNELELCGENRRLMELVMRESDRLDRIISDFLDFARLRPPTTAEVSVTRCLDDMLTLLRNNPALMSGIEAEVRHNDGDLVANADEEQMKQVMLNLAINACEAMGCSGKLTVKTELVGGGFMRIVFQDEGPGIGDEERARLFEPFFTSKEGGTGLGLAIANKIVEAHGGRIQVRNRKPQGAEFSVTLPIQTTSENAHTCEAVGAVG